MRTSFPRPRRTSAPFAQARRAKASPVCPCTSRDPSSTGSLRASWLRAGTSPGVTAGAASPSTGRSSPTRTSSTSTSTPAPASSAWPTPAPTPTGRSSSSRQSPPRTSTAGTASSARSPMAWTSSRRWRQTPRLQGTSPSSPLSSPTAARSPEPRGHPGVRSAHRARGMTPHETALFLRRKNGGVRQNVLLSAPPGPTRVRRGGPSPVTGPNFVTFVMAICLVGLCWRVPGQ
mmetsp:Transcript_18125/g.45664  ORF Transcript_18125/g.45664 Transcript_18125/m.45664 type:complete len:232 (+) Transcript_18125:281-976(+)